MSKVDPSSEGTADASNEKAATPPQSAAHTTRRRLIIFAFWAVVVALGLPHWVWTTAVYRSDLPVDAMTSWSEGKACKVRFPITIDLQSSSMSVEQRASVTVRLDALLNVHGDASPYHYKVSPAADPSVSPTVILQLETDDSDSGLHYALDPWSPTVTVTRGPITPGDDDLLASQLHQVMQQIMVDEHASIALLLRDSPLQTNFRDGSAFTSRFESLQRRTTRAFKPAPSYHLTFSLFSGGSAPSSWDIKTATEQYVSPLLSALSSISNFTVDTQVQLHASISPAIAGPTFEAATNTWTLLATDLSGFVNAAEWQLSPGICL
ncbi:GPI transamidase component [Oleoguttula sp. CCFEE 5521]